MDRFFLAVTLFVMISIVVFVDLTLEIVVRLIESLSWPRDLLSGRMPDGPICTLFLPTYTKTP